MTRVALVGVGTMGLPMGRRLLEAGHEVVACDLDPARIAALGARRAATPAEAFADSEVAITSLPSPEAVELVVLGSDGLLSAARPGTTVIDMSTSSPALARRLAGAGAAARAEVLDAPVSGGPRGAEAGTLTIMVGGNTETVDRCRPLLECLGRVIHAGGHGTGQAVKLCNNLLAGSAMAALAEACSLAVAEGIDPGVLYSVLTTSTGDSRVLHTRFPIPGVDPLHPASAGYQALFELDLLAKDLDLVQALAAEHGVGTPVTAAALEQYRASQRAGLGKLDYSAVYLSRRSAHTPVAPQEAGGEKRSTRIPVDALRAFGGGVLERHGVAAPVAAAVLDCLIEADSRGVHTHGLLRLPAYCTQVGTGEIDATAIPVIVHEDGPTALVDGRFAFGAVSGAFAADDAARRAREHGMGATAVRNGNHFGSAAHYSLRIARRGLVGLVACNTPAAMAPWGASESRLGNNPLSIAAPRGERPPLVLDLALSASSRGRIKLAELDGEEIPSGWALDSAGRPTTDPAAALAGALLPVGGHKGSGLAIAVEALTAALSGAGISPRLVNTGLTGSGGDAAERGVGYLVVALDPGRFAGTETFVSRLDELGDELKKSRLAPGFDEVLVPGELEHRLELAAEADGVELPVATLEGLRALAANEGIPFPG